MNIKRGDIYYADLSPVVGSEQGGLRPVLIVQNDIGNRYSPTVIAAAITSRMSKTKLPTHIDIYASEVGLQKDSVVLLEQIRTLDKRRLRERMGHLNEKMMHEVDTAISVSFGLTDTRTSYAAGEGRVYTGKSTEIHHIPAVAAKTDAPHVTTVSHAEVSAVSSESRLT